MLSLFLSSDFTMTQWIQAQSGEMHSTENSGSQTFLYQL